MPVTITIDGLPSACQYCGHEAEGWPVRVMNGEVIVACPECHSRVAAVYAVAATCPDPDCGADGCPEHPRHIGDEHTWEMHHSRGDHQGGEPCRCIDA